MTAGRRALTVLLGILAVLAVVLGVLLVRPPATLADRLLERATNGRLRLAEAQGSLWDGSGRVVLVDPARLVDARADVPGDADEAARDGPSGRPLPGWAVPGVLRWNVSPVLLVGRVQARLALDGAPEPVRLEGSWHEASLSAGSLAWPRVRFDEAGSPWNTLRPGAGVRLRWSSLRLSSAGVHGNAVLELLDVSSALTDIRPLGSWSLAIDARGPEAGLRLETLSGPLNVQGEGRWTRNAGMRLLAEAWPDPAVRPRLAPLLALLGPRQGDRTVIRVGG